MRRHGAGCATTARRSSCERGARVGVVGHVEWIQFAVVPALPAAGEITHATSDLELAAGGGAVAAVQLGRLAGTAALYTALGDDAHGGRAREELTARGLEVHAATRPGAPTRRGITYLDDAHERTITLLDPRMVPYGEDPLPWERIAGLDAVYFTGGDAEALRAARAARVLVATSRRSVSSSVPACPSTCSSPARAIPVSR